jgi:hypothetical protein
MTAAAAREELEAVIHRQLTRAWKYGLEPYSGHSCPAVVILAAHDAAIASLPQPPRYARLACEPACDATDKPGHAADAYFCTSQDGHAPPHLAHDADGNIVHAWEGTGTTGRPA